MLTFPVVFTALSGHSCALKLSLQYYCNVFFFLIMNCMPPVFVGWLPVCLVYALPLGYCICPGCQVWPWQPVCVRRLRPSWLVPWGNMKMCRCSWRPWTFCRTCWEGNIIPTIITGEWYVMQSSALLPMKIWMMATVLCFVFFKINWH